MNGLSDGEGGESEVELEVDFSSPSYEPEGFAYNYFLTHSHAQAFAFARSLDQQKSLATQQIQRKVYTHYEKFIESSKVVATVQTDLGKLRRALGQLDTSLHSLQTQAENLVQFSAKLTTPSRQNKLKAREAKLSEDSLYDELEAESRYNKVVLLNESKLGWILGAPETLEVLIYERRYREAVDLILRVRLSESGRKEDPEEDTEVVWARRRAQHKVDKQTEGLIYTLLKCLEDGIMLVAPSIRRQSSVKTTEDTGDVRPSAASSHPARLLLDLGKDYEACKAYLCGQKRMIRSACQNVMTSTLAGDIEECVLEIAQRVFRGILDCVAGFKDHFMKSKLFNRQLHLPLLVRWATEEMEVYCQHFIRFLLPEFRERGPDESSITEEQSKEAEEQNRAATFSSERSTPLHSAPGLLVLTSKEWAILGTCLRYTFLLCRRLEKDGFSLAFAVESELHVALSAAIEGSFRRLHQEIRGELLKEKWHSRQLRIETSEKKERNDEAGEDSKQDDCLSLTASTLRLYDLMHELIRNVKKIISTNYLTTSRLKYVVTELTLQTFGTYIANIMESTGAWSISGYDSGRFEDTVHLCKQRGEPFKKICSILETPEHVGRQLTSREIRVVKVVLQSPLTTAQQIAQLSDVYYICNDLAPRVRQKYEALFKSSLVPLWQIQVCEDVSSESAIPLLCTAFARRQAVYFLEDVLRWSQFNYANVDETTKISHYFTRAFEELSVLKEKLTTTVGAALAYELIAQIVEEILSKLCANHLRSKVADQKRSIHSLFGQVSAQGYQRVEQDLQLLLDCVKQLFDREPTQRSKEFVAMLAQTLSEKFSDEVRVDGV